MPHVFIQVPRQEMTGYSVPLFPRRLTCRPPHLDIVSVDSIDGVYKMLRMINAAVNISCRCQPVVPSPLVTPDFASSNNGALMMGRRVRQSRCGTSSITKSLVVRSTAPKTHCAATGRACLLAAVFARATQLSSTATMCPGPLSFNWVHRRSQEHKSLRKLNQSLTVLWLTSSCKLTWVVHLDCQQVK